jgi:hypothetical protein
MPVISFNGPDYLEALIPAANQLWLITNTGAYNPNGETWSLWKSDGTAAGTTLVKRGFTADLISAEWWTTQLAWPVGNTLLFFGQSRSGQTYSGGLWASDGTTAGTQLILNAHVSYLGSANGTAFFTSTIDAVQQNLYAVQLTPRVSFAIDHSQVRESAGAARLLVQLSQPSAQPITVQYAVTGGIAAGGVDYTLSPGTLTFAPGQTRATIVVPLIDDKLDEFNETLQVTLANPTNANLGHYATHTLTILQYGRPPLIYFSLTASSAAETSGKVLIAVQLSAPSGKPVTVNVAPARSTAVAGVDYTLPDKSITIAPGETEASIEVDLLDDGKPGPNKRLILTLSTPVHATLGTRRRHTLTILE